MTTEHPTHADGPLTAHINEKRTARSIILVVGIVSHPETPSVARIEMIQFLCDPSFVRATGLERYSWWWRFTVPMKAPIVAGIARIPDQTEEGEQEYELHVSWRFNFTLKFLSQFFFFNNGHIIMNLDINQLDSIIERYVVMRSVYQSL
jgi:hypothetical protein